MAELKKLRLTKELAIAEAEMKAIDQVEETQSEFTERSEDMLRDNLIEDSCKDDLLDLLRNYLESQASSVTERSISTMETNLGGKSKIVLQKPVSKVSEIVNSCQDKQNEGCEGNVEPSVQRPSSLNLFSPNYVAFSTPKNAQSAIYPLEDSSIPQLQQSKSTLSKHQEEIAQKQTSSDVLERLADLMTKRHAHEQLPLPEPETFNGDLFHYPT